MSGRASTIRHPIIRGGGMPRTEIGNSEGREDFVRRLSDRLDDILAKACDFTPDDFSALMESGGIIDAYLSEQGIARYERQLKIDRRVDRWLHARMSAVRSGLSHLKEAEANTIKAAIGRGVIAGVVTEHEMHTRVAEIHAKFPWMGQATSAIMRAMRSAFSQPGVAGGRRGLTFPPMILLGSPGIGKSAWARQVAKTFGVASIELDVGASGGSNFSLVGPERGWGNAAPGRLVSHMLSECVANTVVVVDEIDNAPSTVVTSSGKSLPGIQETLKSLMEPVTAREWTCPFYQVKFDMSRINWIMSANRVSENMNSSFMDRVALIKIEDPSPAQVIAAGRGMLAGKITDEDDRFAAENVLESRIAEMAARGKRVSLRDARRLADDLISAVSAPMMN